MKAKPVGRYITRPEITGNLPSRQAARAASRSLHGAIRGVDATIATLEAAADPKNRQSVKTLKWLRDNLVAAKAEVDAT